MWEKWKENDKKPTTTVVENSRKADKQFWPCQRIIKVFSWKCEESEHFLIQFSLLVVCGSAFKNSILGHLAVLFVAQFFKPIVECVWKCLFIYWPLNGWRVVFVLLIELLFIFKRRISQPSTKLHSLHRTPHE